MKLLLDRSANIEAKNNYGDTALSQAIISKHADVSQLLQQTNPRGTLNQYLAQLRTLHGSDDCKRCSNSDRNPYYSLLREQIIKLAVKLQPPPAVPKRLTKLSCSLPPCCSNGAQMQPMFNRQ